MSRLSQQSPELVELLQSLDETTTKTIAVAVSELALVINHIHDAWVDEVIEDIKSGDKTDEQQIAALQMLSATTEEPYLQAIGNDIDVSGNTELMAQFHQARAIDALIAASSSDLDDTIYESMAAGVTPEQIKEIIVSIQM